MYVFFESRAAVVDSVLFGPVPVLLLEVFITAFKYPLLCE